MAVGKYVTQIDSDDLVKGLTTSSNLTDGGFTPETDCVNLLANPGVVYPPNGVTTLGTIGGRVITHSFDNNQDPTHPGYDKWLITSDGGLYYVTGTTLGSYASGAPAFTPSKYAVGVSDMLPFETSGSPAYPDVYVTQKSDITKFVWDYAGSPNPTLRSLDEAWWTTTKGQAALTSNPHPMAVFNKTMFVADGNMLHTWDGTTATSAVLTLAPYEVITALLVDPGTGRLLVAISSRGLFSGVNDYSVSMSSPTYMGIYDGVNPTQFLRKIPMDGTVTAMRNVGGTVHVAFGNKLGAWNGNGITFLRNFNFQQNAPSVNTYKLRMTNIDNMLFFVNNSGNTNPFLQFTNSQIMAYGEVTKGTKAFFPIMSTSADTVTDFVSNLGNTGLLYSHIHTDLTTFKLYYLPVQSKSTVLVTGDNSPIFVSKRLTFSRPSVVNQVRILFEDSVAANDAIIGNLSVIDDKRVVAYNKDISNPSTSAGATTWFDIYPDVNTTECQIKYQWKETSTSHGIQKIMVFYTPYE